MKWIRCTERQSRDHMRKTWINIDRAVALSVLTNGDTRIKFYEDASFAIDVTEGIDYLIGNDLTEDGSVPLSTENAKPVVEEGIKNP